MIDAQEDVFPATGRNLGGGGGESATVRLQRPGSGGVPVVATRFKPLRASDSRPLFFIGLEHVGNQDCCHQCGEGSECGARTGRSVLSITHLDG